MRTIDVLTVWSIFWGASTTGVALTVNKCCPEGEVLSEEGTCERSRNKWRPFVASTDDWTNLNDEETDALLEVWKLRIGRPTCERDEESKFVTVGDRHFLFLSNGSLWMDGEIVFPRSFCFDRESAIVCVGRSNGSESARDLRDVARVKKCCGDGKVYSKASSGCSASRPRPKLFELPSNFLRVKIHLENGFPVCRNGYIETGKLSEGDGSTLERDGSLRLAPAGGGGGGDDGDGLVLKPRTFCLESIEEENDNFPTIFTCPKYLPTRGNGSGIAIQRGDLRLTLYPLALFASVFFLAVTLAVGYLLPTTHHVLHWRCQTCYVACLMVADFLLAVTQIAGHSFPREICTAIAILMHVLFLAAFFWLNTMCFNIWWTFRDLRPTSLNKSQEVWRLRMYEIYAWGVPSVIATVAAALDHLPRDRFPSILKPDFAVKNCWFHGNLEIFTYFYGPVGILLLLNLVLFALTARELTCGLWRSEVVKSTTERATLGKVCLKLVVVMGITWVADVTSWAVGGRAVWYATDIANALQGVFIFLVVGCQPQMWTMVRRLWCFRGTTNAGANGNRQSCSQDVPSVGESTFNNTQNTTNSKIPVGETSC